MNSDGIRNDLKELNLINLNEKAKKEALLTRKMKGKHRIKKKFQCVN